MPYEDDELEDLLDEEEAETVQAPVLKMVRATNSSGADATWDYDSLPYTVPAGKSRVFTREVAEHLQKYHPHLELEEVTASFKAETAPKFQDPETKEVFESLAELTAAAKARALQGAQADSEKAIAAAKKALEAQHKSELQAAIEKAKADALKSTAAAS